MESYLNYSGRGDILSGGTRVIPIATPKGEYRVWTKRVGSNPRVKVLLLHGGPALTHEYWEACDSYFPAAGIEYYYYDQLGSAFSDQPDDPDLWELPRFVDEVEQVRRALGLSQHNFFLMGHSWGGILAIEYALKHQENLKGLVISNMVCSIPEYNRYAQTVLRPQMEPSVLAEITALEAGGGMESPRYMDLMVPHHFEQHVLRMPADEWPDPVNRTFEKANESMMHVVLGAKERGSQIRGRLLEWDRTEDMGRISVPTLTVGAANDTMDPALIERMAGLVQNGRYLHCPNGSHFAMYDDQGIYFAGVIDFIKDVDAGL